jgi:hypothetical protein
MKLLAEESYPNNLATAYPLIGKGGVKPTDKRDKRDVVENYHLLPW